MHKLQASKIKKKKRRSVNAVNHIKPHKLKKSNMNAGFSTNLYVFTGHVFHHSREEIWCIFTSGYHLQRKHKYQQSRFDKVTLAMSFTHFNFFKFIPANASPSLSFPMSCRYDEWSDVCGTSERRFSHRLSIFNSQLLYRFSLLQFQFVCDLHLSWQHF